MTDQQSYLIIGAGVFGVSTAYHLLHKYPKASITLIDRDSHDAPSRVAASWDWNKVVRADYDDLVYCRLGIEAQDVFKSDPLWKPFFHETGIYWICRSDYATDVIRNYEVLGRKADLKAVPVQEARRMFGGLFEEADYGGAKEVLVNKTSGWAAAGDCLTAVTKWCIERGVRYVTAEVTGLKFDDVGRCVGVVTPTGRTVEAKNTILCTGAYTPKLLEYSAERSGILDLRAGPRIVAGGITTGMVTLDEKTHQKFAKMPVGVQGYTAETGPFIGSLPPTKDREIKWWGQTIFRNTLEVLPGRHISTPPARPDYAQWKIPEMLKEDIRHASNVFYGPQTATWKHEKHRICWDAFTTSGDFIISPHSASPNLFVATCGNFHGWKFFPVIGKYIVQMLEGNLEPELVQKWAWDRVLPDPIHFADWPRKEMNYLLAPERTARL